MKEIIEKYKSGKLKLSEFFDEGYKLELLDVGKRVTGYETKIDSESLVTHWNERSSMDHRFVVIKSSQLDKEIAAMEKQPTEYEYVKVTDSIFDLKVEFEAGDLFVQLLGDSGEYRVIEEEDTLIDEIRDDNVYRRIPLTAEQLHERNVEELARLLSRFDDGKIEIEFTSQPMDFQNSYRDYAKAALEWMESKGE